MKKNLISFFLIITACLDGNLEKHFKPAPFKESQNANPIENVDFAYVINLDQRPEKFEHTIKELAPYNIHPYRFSAVNGWELSIEAINEVGVPFEPWMKNEIMGTCYLDDKKFKPHHEMIKVIGRTYFVHCMAPGTIGIVLSHLSILQDAYDSGYNTIWVMEDDIEVIKNPHLLSELIAKLDDTVGYDNWDILFTDLNTKSRNGNYVSCMSYAPRPNFTPAQPERFALNHPINHDFRKIGARYGAYSMIVRRSGMKKLLDFIKEYKIFLPFDMEYTLPDDINLYTVQEDIVSTQCRAISDNGGANYKKKAKELKSFIVNAKLDLYK